MEILWRRKYKYWLKNNFFLKISKIVLFIEHTSYIRISDRMLDMLSFPEIYQKCDDAKTTSIKSLRSLKNSLFFTLLDLLTYIVIKPSFPMTLLYPTMCKLFSNIFSSSKYSNLMVISPDLPEQVGKYSDLALSSKKNYFLISSKY